MVLHPIAAVLSKKTSMEYYLGGSSCQLVRCHIDYFLSLDKLTNILLGNFVLVFEKFAKNDNISFTVLPKEVRVFIANAPQCVNKNYCVTPDFYDDYGLSAIIVAKSVHPSLYKNERFLYDLVSVDKTRLFPYTVPMIKIVIERIRHLINLDRQIWNFNKDEYISYMKLVVKKAKESHLPYDLYTDIIEVLPALDGCGPKPYVDNVFTEYDTEVCAYILGLPAHLYSLPREALNKMYEEYKEDPQAYIEAVYKHNYDTTNKIIDEYKTRHGVELTICNNSNTLLEDIDHHSPVDIYRLIEGDKLFQFTRSEFSTLLDKNKNFWNRAPLSRFDNLNITQLNSIGTVVGPCLPLAELLENTLKPSVCNIQDLVRAEHNLPPRYNPRVDLVTLVSEDEYEDPPFDSDEVPQPFEALERGPAVVTMEMLNMHGGSILGRAPHSPRSPTGPIGPIGPNHQRGSQSVVALESAPSGASNVPELFVSHHINSDDESQEESVVSDYVTSSDEEEYFD